MRALIFIPHSLFFYLRLLSCDPASSIGSSSPGKTRPLRPIILCAIFCFFCSFLCPLFISITKARLTDPFPFLHFPKFTFCSTSSQFRVHALQPYSLRSKLTQHLSRSSILRTMASATAEKNPIITDKPFPNFDAIKAEHVVPVRPCSLIAFLHSPSLYRIRY